VRVVEGGSDVRLIGWLCVIGAGFSLMGGLLSGHFAPYSRRSRRGRSDLKAFIQEEAPGFIPGVVIAIGLLVLGLLILAIGGVAG
jgi:hypothetical protein